MMNLRLAVPAAFFLAVLAFPTTVSAQASDTPFQVKYVNASKANDSQITVMNSGASGTGTLVPGNAATTPGALCANLYAFASADGSLQACCSCPVGPNAARTLSLNRDLLPVAAQTNALVKTTLAMTATVPGGGSCTGAAATTARPLGTGLLASATSSTPPLATIQSDSPFAPSTLSAAEYNKITGACAALPGAGPVCTACQ